MILHNRMTKWHAKSAGPRHWIGLLLGACIVASSIGVMTSASAARTLRALPHVETFDSNAYTSDIVWVSEGCTQTWMPSGGLRGGAAKFTPSLTGQAYCGLGQFMFSGIPTLGEQINVRFLIYHGSTWNEYAGINNKLVVMNRAGNGGRPMIITRRWNSGSSAWETWGACDGTVCRYEGGDFWPDGTDSLRIGNPPIARQEEWISVELEANTRTGMIRLYVTSRDSVLNGLYVERYMDSSGPGGTWSYIDIIGGYFNDPAVRADPNNYFMIDELVIDSRYIGPPPDFAGPRPVPPSNISVR